MATHELPFKVNLQRDELILSSTLQYSSKYLSGISTGGKDSLSRPK